MSTQRQPNTTMPRTLLKLAAFTALALCCAAPAYSNPNSSTPQQKIVLLSDLGSQCLFGDECPETRSEKDEFGQLKGKPQVLPALLSLGWRIVSFTPVEAEEAYSKFSVAFPSAYVLLEKK